MIIVYIHEHLHVVCHVIFQNEGVTYVIDRSICSARREEGRNDQISNQSGVRLIDDFDVVWKGKEENLQITASDASCVSRWWGMRREIRGQPVRFLFFFCQGQSDSIMDWLKRRGIERERKEVIKLELYERRGREKERRVSDRCRMSRHA